MLVNVSTGDFGQPIQRQRKIVRKGEKWRGGRLCWGDNSRSQAGLLRCAMVLSPPRTSETTLCRRLTAHCAKPLITMEELIPCMSVCQESQQVHLLTQPCNKDSIVTSAGAREAMGVLATEVWGYSRRHGGAHEVLSYVRKTRTNGGYGSGDFGGDFGVGAQGRHLKLCRSGF